MCGSKGNGEIPEKLTQQPPGHRMNRGHCTASPPESTPQHRSRKEPHSRPCWWTGILSTGAGECGSPGQGEPALAFLPVWLLPALWPLHLSLPAFCFLVTAVHSRPLPVCVCKSFLRIHHQLVALTWFSKANSRKRETG